MHLELFTRLMVIAERFLKERVANGLTIEILDTTGTTTSILHGNLLLILKVTVNKFKCLVPAYARHLIDDFDSTLIASI